MAISQICQDWAVRPIIASTALSKVPQRIRHRFHLGNFGVKDGDVLFRDGLYFATDS